MGLTHGRSAVAWYLPGPPRPLRFLRRTGTTLAETLELAHPLSDRILLMPARYFKSNTHDAYLRFATSNAKIAIIYVAATRSRRVANKRNGRSKTAEKPRESNATASFTRRVRLPPRRCLHLLYATFLYFLYIEY